MEEFNYCYPVKVYFGEKVAKKAMETEVSKVGNKVMLAYGGGSIKRVGIYDEIVDALKKLGKEIIEFPGIMPNPTYSKVQEGARLAKENNVDFILAVGGGSVIDCSKIISVQAKLDEDIYDDEYKKGKFPTDGIPFGAIVTSSGTGAEMNAGAVITYEEKKWKGALFGSLAKFAILDPTYTMSVPRIQVLSGAFDTLSHAMETFMGNSDKDNVSDDLSLAIMKNTVINIRRVIKDINDIQARGNLMWDSAIAENGILKVGRFTDFQVHQIEHQLGAFTDCNHGQGLAVIQPVYYKHILNDAREKLEKIASVVFGVATAEEGIDELEKLVKECGLPSMLGQLKSKIEITDEVLREVANSTNIVKYGPRQLSHEEIFEILCECK